jgi:hypothetical protein
VCSAQFAQHWAGDGRLQFAGIKGLRKGSPLLEILWEMTIDGSAIGMFEITNNRKGRFAKLGNSGNQQTGDERLATLFCGFRMGLSGSQRGVSWNFDHIRPLSQPIAEVDVYPLRTRREHLFRPV